MGGKGLDPSSLVSTHLIEVGEDDSFLWSWSYPHLDNDLREICLRKCKVLYGRHRAQSSVGGVGKEVEDGGAITGFFHLDKFWFYTFMSKVSKETLPESFSSVKYVGVIVVAVDFNPEKYQRVGSVLYLTFLKTGDASIVLQQFLSLVVDKMCLLPKKKTLLLRDYEGVKPYDKHNMKEIISMFGLETILIHTGLRRRRRVVVYHYDINVLKEFTLSLPVFHFDEGDIWDFVYPWVDLNENELNYFKSMPFYVMGCTNAEVESRLELFDIFINIPAAEITVAPHARESISMNKAHKELATFMVKLASSEEVTEDELVEEVTKHSILIVDKPIKISK